MGAVPLESSRDPTKDVAVNPTMHCGAGTTVVAG